MMQKSANALAMNQTAMSLSMEGRGRVASSVRTVLSASRLTSLKVMFRLAHVVRKRIRMTMFPVLNALLNRLLPKSRRLIDPRGPLSDRFGCEGIFYFLRITYEILWIAFRTAMGYEPNVRMSHFFADYFTYDGLLVERHP